MKEWEILNIKSRAFLCEDYTEALAAIKDWWDTLKTDTSVINVIVFHINDDLDLEAEVFYAV